MDPGPFGDCQNAGDHDHANRRGSKGTARRKTSMIDGFVEKVTNGSA
jgi:hypothetical protein